MRSSYAKNGKFARRLREKTARKFLVYVGKDVNIEKGAMITSKMEIGDRSGVGINARMHGKVIIGKDVMMGSYDLSFYAAIGVHCKNVTQTIDILDKRYWGIYTSNFCKNLSLENCKISRFDAHQGVTNVSIRNCEIGHQQIKLIGFGEAVIENTVVHAPSWCFIELRGDYGSIWDGNVTIKNCTWQPSRSNASLISASNSQDHDYGYKCMMPHTITIDGLYIEDGSFNESELGKLTIFNSFDNAPAEGKPYPYEPTEKLVLKNVRTESKYDYSISQNPALFEKLVVEK
jgi:hypothetical protein